MPTYEITDPDTGKTLTVTGDTPPTQEDAAEIFAAQTPDYNYGAELAAKVGQGLTFGFGDEITSGVEALVRSLGSERTFDDIFSEEQQRKKELREAFEAENPGAAITAELLGGLATGGAGAGRVLASQAIRNAPRLLRGTALAGTGAVEGGLYGVGTADAGERLQNGAEGAAIGAVAAPVLAPVTNVLGRLVSGGADRALKAAESSPTLDALRVVRQMADEGGVTAEGAIDTMRKLGPEATLADTSEALRSTARSVMNRPGRARDQGLDVVDARNRQQRDRLLTQINSTAGLNRTFAQAEREIVERRSREAKPFYDAAEAQGIEITPSLKPLLSNINVLRAANKILDSKGLPKLKKPTAKDFLQQTGGNLEEAKALAAKATPFDNLTPQMRYDVLQGAKQGLDDRIEGKFSPDAPGKKAARNLLETKNNLLQAMGEQNPNYLKANSIFSDESALRDAHKLGNDFLSNKYQTEDIRDFLREMSPGEKEMFQAGAIGDVARRIEQSPAVDKSRVFRNRADYQDKLKIVLGDKADDFLKRVDIEEEFAATRQAVSGNSTTAMQQKFQEKLDEMVDPGIVREMADLNPTNVIGKVINVLTRRKPSSEVIDQIGNILLGQGYTDKQIRNILQGSPIRRALGDDYDQVIRPYLAGATVSAGTPLVTSVQE